MKEEIDPMKELRERFLKRVFKLLDKSFLNSLIEKNKFGS